VEDLYTGTTLTIEAPVSKGYYFLLDGIETTLDVVQRLRQRMREIIAEGHRFHRLERPTEEVAELFRAHGQKDKAILIESLGKLYCHYYRLCDTYDYYYGPLVPSTDFLDEFDLVRYYNGMLLRIPREEGKIPEIVKQERCSVPSRTTTSCRNVSA
jgi:uridine kinase